MMELDEGLVSGLRVLAAVVRTRSFVGASRALGLTQSGVSRAISKLEGRLGLRVLHRTTRSVTVTEEGQNLFDQTSPLLEELAAVTSTVADGRVQVRGKLRIQMHPTLAHLLRPSKLASFLEAHPELRVELIIRDVLGDLVRDGFDLALHVGRPPTSGLIARKLTETRILTVAAPRYLKRYGTPLAPEELANKHVFIDYRDPETDAPFEWEFHRASTIVPVQTSGRVVVSDIVTMHRLCMAGFGIAQVMEIAVAGPLRRGRLVPLFPGWTDERFPLWAIYPSRKFMPAKTKAFLAMLSTLTFPPTLQTASR